MASEAAPSGMAETEPCVREFVDAVVAAIYAIYNGNPPANLTLQQALDVIQRRVDEHKAGSGGAPVASGRIGRTGSFD
jgi:hypothetical protein